MKNLNHLIAIVILLLGFTSNNLFANKTWPNCNTPKNFSIISSSEHILNIQWDGEIPAIDGIRYELQLFSSNEMIHSKIEFLRKSFQLDWSRFSSLDSVRIRSLCDGYEEKFTEYSKWNTLIIESEARDETVITVCNPEGPIENPQTEVYFQYDNYSEQIRINLNTDLTDYTGSPIIKYRLHQNDDFSYINVSENSISINATTTEAQNFEGYYYLPYSLNNGTIVCYTEYHILLEVDEPELFNCGEHPDDPVLTNQNLNYGIISGDIFLMNNFPVYISNISHNNGVYSGTGKVIIPFRDEELIVYYNGVKINTDNIAIEGTMIAEVANPADFPGIKDTFHIGQETCLPPPEIVGFDENGLWQPGNTPYNPFGFDPAGNYIKPPYLEGNPYDPNGFDSDGNHVLTGNQYNPEGCSQQGLDEEGNPCNPAGPFDYYWESEADSPEIEAFADSIKTILDELLNPIVDSIGNVINDSISQKQALFQQLQSELLQDVENKDPLKFEVNKVLFFGPDNMFIQPGFSDLMEDPQLSAKGNKSDVYMAIEKKHFELYQIDEARTKFDKITQTIVELEANTTNLKDEIYFKLLSLSVEEHKELNSENAIKELLINSILDYVERNSIAMHTIQNSKDILNNKSSGPLDLYNSMASNGPIVNETEDSYMDRVSFEYLQNFKMVGNRHRAFTTQNLHFQKSLLNTNGDGGSILPISITKEIAGIEYSVYIDRMEFTPTSSFLDAYLVLNEPTSGKNIIFEAENIPFTAGGLKDQDNSSALVLASNISFRVSNALKAILKGDEDKTYITWDCNGIDEISANFSLEVCRNYLIPLDPITMDTLANPNKVSLDFAVKTKNGWGDFYTAVDIDPFVVTKAKDVKWRIQSVIIDLSDISSPGRFEDKTYNSFTVNEGYPTPLWKGIYFGELSAQLPNTFSSDEEDVIAVGIKKSIFDENGFTGEAFVSPILNIEKGNLDGWAFSIDTFSVKIQQNNLTGGGLAGAIHIPLFKKTASQDIEIEDCFRYTASYDTDDGFVFGVRPKPSMKAPLWLAEIELMPNSQILVSKDEKGYFAEANLHGIVNVGGEVASGVKLELGGIKFQNLKISNRDPHFDVGTWSPPNSLGAQFNGFGINIKVPKIKPLQNGEYALGLGLNINVGGKDKGFAAGGDLDLIFEMEYDSKGRQKYVYKNFLLNELLLGGSCPGVGSMYGKINFFRDDPTYGSGFRGIISMNIDALDVGLSCVGVFGKTTHNSYDNSEYNYFLIDAFANLGSGIPIGSGVNLIGFGGGLSYHMKRTNDAVSLASAPLDAAQLPSSLGTSLSGVIYEPDQGTSLRLKSTIALALLEEKAFNVNAFFEIQFFEKPDGGLGGVEYIAIGGVATFMDALKLDVLPEVNGLGVSPTVTAQISIKANLVLNFNFIDQELEGTAEVFLLTPFMRGGMDYNSGKLVSAELKIDKDEYYLNIGRPERDPDNDRRCKLSYTFPFLGEIAGVSAYFDIGTNIPPLPELPASLAAYKDEFAIDENLRNSGAGFAMGLQFLFDKQLSISNMFSASATIDVGGDMMMQNYSNLTCNGEPVGLNGWYGMGNVWFFVDGKLNVLGEDLVDLNLVCLGQAKFPSPFHFKGIIEGDYNGIKWDYELEIGDECDFVGQGNPLSDKEFIITSTPIHEEVNVSLDIAPVITFGIPLNQEISMENINGEQIEYELRIKEITVADENGYETSISRSYAESGLAVTLNFPSWLENNTTYNLFCAVELLKNGSVDKTEEYSISFNTGNAPTELIVTNIIAEYPSREQKNFYPQQNNKETGHVLLENMQVDLMLFSNFESSSIGKDDPFSILNVQTTDYSSNNIYARIWNNSEEFTTKAKVSGTEIIYDLPADKLTSGETYFVEIKINSGELKKHTIYSNKFRVSQFPTFIDKINAYIATKTESTKVSGLTLNLNANNTVEEGFSTYEFENFMSFGSQINNSSWYLLNYKTIDEHAKDHSFALNQRDHYTQIPNNQFISSTLKELSSFDGSSQQYGDGIGLLNTDEMEVPKTQLVLTDSKYNTYKLDWHSFKGEAIGTLMLQQGLKAECEAEFDVDFTGNTGCDEFVDETLNMFIGLDAPTFQGDVKFKISYRVPGGFFPTDYIIVNCSSTN